MRPISLMGAYAALILVATALGFLSQQHFDLSQARFETLLPYLGATLTASAICLPASGLDKPFWRSCSRVDDLRAGSLIIWVSIGAVSLSFLYNRLDGIERTLPLFQCLAGVALLTGARMAHRLFHSVQSDEMISDAPALGLPQAERSNILVVGLNSLAEDYSRAAAETGKGRVNVAGILACSERHVGRTAAGHPVLGHVRDVRSVLDRLEARGVVIGRIVVALPFEKTPQEAIEALRAIERSNGVRLQFLSEDLDGAGQNSHRALSRAAAPSPDFER